MDNRKKVWLDCDPGLDDAFAIILAAHQPLINLLGVSTSAGNSTLQNTTKNALDLLHNINRKDVLVVKGSPTLISGEPKYAEHIHGEGGFGGVELPKAEKPAIQEDSFQFIKELLLKQNEKIIWANTGSLTNLCMLLKEYPEVKDKISQIVIMGGAIGKGNRTPAAEFNIFFDPEAAKQVFQHKGNIPLIMIPLELTHQVEAKQPIFQFLTKYQKIPLARALHKLLMTFKQMCFKSAKQEYPPIHDPCVINYIINSEDFELHKAIIEVDTYPSSYGRTNCYFNNPLEPEKPIQSIDLVGVKMRNRKKFWKYFHDILTQIFEDDLAIKKQ